MSRRRKVKRLTQPEINSALAGGAVATAGIGSILGREILAAKIERINRGIARAKKAGQKEIALQLYGKGKALERKELEYMGWGGAVGTAALWVPLLGVAGWKRFKEWRRQALERRRLAAEAKRRDLKKRLRAERKVRSSPGTSSGKPVSRPTPRPSLVPGKFAAPRPKGPTQGRGRTSKRATKKAKRKEPVTVERVPERRPTLGLFGIAESDAGKIVELAIRNNRLSLEHSLEPSHHHKPVPWGKASARTKSARLLFHVQDILRRYTSEIRTGELPFARVLKAGARTDAPPTLLLLRLLQRKPDLVVVGIPDWVKGEIRKLKEAYG